MSSHRVVIYGRVSKDHSEGKSVDAQLTECRTWAGREGWAIVAEHRDDGISASKYANGKARPGWQATMDLITTGKVDLLVVWEISRATRDRAVWTALLAACQERDVKIGTGGRVHDPSDPDDGFMMDLMAALAVRESGVTSKRIRRTVRATAAAGLPHGKIPYGYRRVYDQETKRLLRQEPDPQTAPIVREIARRLLAGEALYAVAEDLNSRGVLTPRAEELTRLGKPIPPLVWDPIQVKRLAITPTNAGLRSLNGTVVGQAQWEGLISENDHHTLKQRLTDPSRKTWRDGSVKHLLVGIAECGVCGSPVRRVKNRGCPSYACWAGKGTGCVSRAQHFVDAYVETWILGIFEQPEVLALGTPGDDGKAAEAAIEAEALQAQLDSYIDQAATLSPATLAKVEARLEPLIRDARRRATIAYASPLVAELAGKNFDQAWKEWQQFTVPQRREVVRTLVRVHLLRTQQGIHHLDEDSVAIHSRVEACEYCCPAHASHARP